MQDAFDFSEPETDSAAVDADGRLTPVALEDLSVWSLERVLDAAGPDTVIATVNQRLSRHLTERHARHRVAAGDHWWETPRILPLDSWLVTLHDDAVAADCSERVRRPGLQARLAWRQIIEESGLPLLDPEATARDAQRAWQLAATWDCAPAKGAWLEADAHAWRTWATRYAEGLDRANAIDDAGIARHLAPLIAGGRLALPSTCVLAGFLMPTPQLGLVIAALQAAGVEVVVLGDGPAGEPRCLTYADDATELRAVAQQLRKRVDATPGAVFGVVVPDLNARRDVVRRAFDRAFFPALTPDAIESIERPYDLSAAEPLAKAPIVATALDALTLSWSRQGLDRHGVARLLLAPCLLDAVSDADARRQLEHQLRDWRVRSCNLQRLRGLLPDDSRLGKSLGALLNRVRSAGADDDKQGNTRTVWADRLQDVLKSFGWPGDDLASDEFQAVQALHGVLDDLRSLDDGQRVGAERVLAEVRRLAAERSHQAESPDVPIRILGRLESHGQRFDALWVLGLDSGQWPAPGRATAFLSQLDQRAAGVPEASAEARLSLARREFAHWCAAAPEVTVSCVRERNGQPLVVASVLADVEFMEVTDDTLLDHIAGAAARESVDDLRGPATDPEQAVRGGTGLISDQAACPFRAFARHRLRIHSLEEPGPGLDARQRGTVLHKALEEFWKVTRSHEALIRLDEEALAERIEASVQAALADEHFIADSLAALEGERITTLVRDWLMTQEWNRPPFTVETFEEPVEFSYGGVSIRVVIDRIDRIDGRAVVIDYKTGRHDNPAAWADERISQPQLPLYALTRDDIEGIAFAAVVREAHGFRGIAADETLLPGVAVSLKSRSVDSDELPQSWEEWRVHWRHSLDLLTTEIAEGFALATPSKEACKYCELAGVCRVAVTPGDDDAGEEVAGSTSGSESA